MHQRPESLEGRLKSAMIDEFSYIKVQDVVTNSTDKFSDGQIACRFPSLLCRKAFGSPFGAVGMASK